MTTTLFQVPLPEEGQSGYTWIAIVLAIGIGALFAVYRESINKRDADKDSRIKRAEDMQDKLTAANASSADVVASLTVTLSQVFELLKTTSQEIVTVKANQAELIRRLDVITSNTDTPRKTT